MNKASLHSALCILRFEFRTSSRALHPAFCALSSFSALRNQSYSKGLFSQGLLPLPYMDMNVSIIGAGPVGLLAALYTHSHFKSARIRVFERRLREEMTGSHGRSINLALSERGLRALDGIAGLKDEILSGAVAMRGRSIHELDSTAGELKIPYGRDVVRLTNGC